MLRNRFLLALVSSSLGMIVVLATAACSTETIVKGAPAPGIVPATGDDAGPGDEGSVTTPVEAGLPPDRSVNGTWEKVAVHPQDGDPIEKLSSIFVRSATDVWTTEGSSNLGTGYYHYDGKQWTGVRYPGAAMTLAGLPSGETLGYGDSLFLKTKTGDAWDALPQPQSAGGPAFIASMWGMSTSALYGSTSAGNMRFDGSSWTSIAGLDTHEGEFAGVSAKDVWFASGHYVQFAHFDGTSWKSQWAALPASVKAALEGPYGIFATAADDVWAMGARRTVIHFDGAAWSIVPGPNDEWGCDLTHGWASSKKNAWLVGKAGCVFHWDGAAWEKSASGVTDDIYAIHGSDPEHVWIAPSSTTTVLRLLPH